MPPSSAPACFSSAWSFGWLSLTWCWRLYALAGLTSMSPTAMPCFLNVFCALQPVYLCSLCSACHLLQPYTYPSECCSYATCHLFQEAFHDCHTTSTLYLPHLLSLGSRIVSIVEKPRVLELGLPGFNVTSGIA